MRGETPWVCLAVLVGNSCLLAAGLYEHLVGNCSAGLSRYIMRNTMNPNFRFLRSLGVYGTMRYLLERVRCKLFGERKIYRIWSKYSHTPLTVRRGTSDLNVFKQIFQEVEYSCLDDVKDVKLVVDCGANVGYSSVYFLNRFPSCKVIAIEPDSGNFSILNENIRKYSDRIKVLNAGIWSSNSNLKISDNVYRDGKEWAVQVEECPVGAPGSIKAIDINTILKESGFDRISILKMDIEGAEAIVFAADTSGWIGKVDNMVIELHDDSHFGPATNLVLDKMSTEGRFRVSRSGELTVFMSCFY